MWIVVGQVDEVENDDAAGKSQARSTDGLDALLVELGFVRMTVSPVSPAAEDAAVEPGGGAERCGIRTGVLFGKGERDQLPAGVVLDYGAILDVGVWVKEQVYTCNAIIVEKKNAVTYTVQLLSSVTLKERREFFRIGVAMRLKYAFPPPDQTGNEVREEWGKRSELEYLKFMDAGSDFADSQMLFATHHHLRPSSQELQWVDSINTPATICGGGVRFKLPRKLREGEMLNLELHLPLKPMRIVHAVGEVIHVMEPVRSPGKASLEFPTGIRFKWIGTRDRELIIQYISSEQLEQLRRLSDSLRYQEEPLADRREAPPGDLGDLRLGELVDEVEHGHLLLLGVGRTEQRPEQLPLVRLQPGLHPPRRRPLQLLAPPGPRRPQLVQAVVGGGLVQPAGGPGHLHETEAERTAV